MKTTNELEAEEKRIQELGAKEINAIWCMSNKKPIPDMTYVRDIMLSEIQGKMADRKETHFDEMVSIIRRVADGADELREEAQELLAKLEGKK
jgi:thymidylate kinase